MKPLSIPPRRVHVEDSFVSPAQCRTILRHLDRCDWHSSMVLRQGTARYQTEVQENFRSSVSTRHEWFGPALLRIVSGIESKLQARFGCNPLALESWQATRYSPGDRFGYHLDAGSWGRSRGGERKRTYLLYLDVPARGGETHFRALGVRVQPRAGRLVVWGNLLPSGECDHAMVHAGLEVKDGIKTTLVSWERLRPIRKAPPATR
jgi:prolyl 4-hydroxylase